MVDEDIEYGSLIRRRRMRLVLIKGLMTILGCVIVPDLIYIALVIAFNLHVLITALMKQM